MFYDYFMSFILPYHWVLAGVILFIAFAFVTCPIEYKHIWRIKIFICLGLLVASCVLLMLPEKEFFYFYYGRPNI